MVIVLAALQWLHILSGIVWFGGYIFMDFVLWPALVRRPAAEAKAMYEATAALTAPLMAASGSLVVILGVILGVVFGPLTSLHAIFSTAYGGAWLAALVIAILLSVWGASWHTRFLGPVWEDGAVRAGALTRLRVGIAVEMTGFALILACMVLLGLGL